MFRRLHSLFCRSMAVCLYLFIYFWVCLYEFLSIFVVFQLELHIIYNWVEKRHCFFSLVFVMCFLFFLFVLFLFFFLLKFLFFDRSNEMDSFFAPKFITPNNRRKWKSTWKNGTTFFWWFHCLTFSFFLNWFCSFSPNSMYVCVLASLGVWVSYSHLCISWPKWSEKNTNNWTHK